jgi:hypothetical protein
MTLALLLMMCLHPGHMTRIEIRANDEGEGLEVAMRIDTADLEAALKRRMKSPVDIDSMTDEQAKKVLSRYLSDTIRLGDENALKPRVDWVGMENHPRHVWLFFELPLPTTKLTSLELTINTLLEVEPELQHVVVLDDNLGDRTVIATGLDKPIVLELSPAPSSTQSKK